MEHEYKEKYKTLELKDLSKESYVDVSCPSCGDSTPVKNLNLDKAIGKCESCNVLFSIEEPILQLQTKSSDGEIKRPAGVDILEYKNELELSLSQPYSYFYMIYASFGYLPAIGALAGFANTGKIPVLFLGLLFAAAFLFTVYKLIMHKRDKIYISIDQKEIHLEYRPKNFNKDKSFSRSDIEQLYVKKNNNGLGLYMIVNSIEGQNHEMILGRFANIGQAKYIEQEIEKYLGLENQKVAGEEG